MPLRVGLEIQEEFAVTKAAMEGLVAASTRSRYSCQILQQALCKTMSQSKPEPSLSNVYIKANIYLRHALDESRAVHFDSSACDQPIFNLFSPPFSWFRTFSINPVINLAHLSFASMRHEDLINGHSPWNKFSIYQPTRWIRQYGNNSPFIIYLSSLMLYFVFRFIIHCGILFRRNLYQEPE